MPFANQILGGQNKLVRPAIQSPNYVHGVSGWSINKDGSAEFRDIVLPAGSGGTVVTFAASAPADPSTGDVWYNTAAGLEANVWSGSAWVPYQIGAGAIGAGAVGRLQLDGTVTARSLGGITTTIAATAPTSPVAGDLWLNSAAGYQLNQWSGSAWTSVKWAAGSVLSAASITGDLIAGNTITAGQLAAGIIVAGIVNGTTITGAQFIATGTAGEILCYNGTPAAGNLVFSFSPTAGTDSHGNAYLEGLVVYHGNAKLQLHVNPAVGNVPAVEMPTGLGSESNHGSLYALTANAGAANEYSYVILAGPANSHDGVNSYISLRSAAKDGSFSGAITNNADTHFNGKVYGTSGVLTLGDKIAADPFTTVTGSLVTAKMYPFSGTADTGTSVVTLGRSWAIPANDASIGTVYRIKAFGFFTQGSTARAWGFRVNVFGQLVCVTTIDATVPPAGNSISWWLEAECYVNSAGTSAEAAVLLKGGLNIIGAHVANDGCPAISSYSVPTIDTTIATTMSISGSIGGTGCTLQEVTEMFERIAPNYQTS